MILIIDYGMGNLRSVQKAFEKSASDVRVASDPRLLESADRVVLPGVGAFGDAGKNIDRLQLRDPLIEWIKKGRPFLGICLGLQFLMTFSEEKGYHAGLNRVPGAVKRFEKGLKVPQIGWNQVSYPKQSVLFQDVPENSYFYFVHSYYVAPEDPAVVAGKTDYGISYASAVASDNLFGVQFHPEKSQEAGLTVIRNFCNL
ncbi:MAG: imidazole glycerol phosphate synthase, glutamine amidotransferase subunit [Elusimicrobia bacterium RIFOXYB2_FULL_49_7]|nr:MAG: imidazole glycerol phosphate synthase, glutamine amidotransferase subunit [Elusimicrobia bacterium RIFOXYB2_FULL_49_7]